MSLIKNVFEQVRADAVAEARAGDSRNPASGANYEAGALSLSGEPATFADDEGNTIMPFCADVDAVDDPHRYYL